jgi:lysophospholipase L1-like esterase
MASVWGGRGSRHAEENSSPHSDGVRPPLTGPGPRSRAAAVNVARWLAVLLGLILMAAGSVAGALKVTPLQTVTVAGQVIKVGSTAPNLHLSGPGEVDLFGQSLPTVPHFAGPVRPRLQLAQITINSELTNFVEGSKASSAERILGARLASGWLHYFVWESVIAGAGALVLVGAVAGWRRIPHRTTVKLLAAGLLVTEAINIGAIVVTAYHAQGALRRVTSLSQLVGSEPPVPHLKKKARPLPDIQAVVLGDSTAAGEGLSLVSHPSRLERVCGRSSDAYAQDLASVNGWRVLNLACSGATIRHGLLGSQHRHGITIPSQIASAERASNASVVIVSIGANDLGWAQMLAYCAAAPRCDDRATTAYFQQQLASFSKDYLELLSRLAALPSHPHVIINRYYNPFGAQPQCLASLGYTPAKLSVIDSRLNALNTVLIKGAAQFGFTSPQPDFQGHGLCTAQSYVQGTTSPAPFHPTALGQLAIALADQAVLRTQG